MPTYEYRCDKCGQQFEVVQSFKDRPLRRHPSCGGGLVKVFHPRGVVFKGSGFYVTDSRPKASSSSSSSGNGSGDTSKTGDSSKGDAKTAKPEKTPATADSSKSETSS